MTSTRRRWWAALCSPREVYSVGEMQRLVVVTRLHAALLLVAGVGVWVCAALAAFIAYQLETIIELGTP